MSETGLAYLLYSSLNKDESKYLQFVSSFHDSNQGAYSYSRYVLTCSKHTSVEEIKKFVLRSFLDSRNNQYWVLDSQLLVLKNFALLLNEVESFLSKKQKKEQGEYTEIDEEANSDF